MKPLRSIKKAEAGFTLIEIMIVVLIIGILLAVAVPNWVKARETSHTKACVANLKRIDSAKEQWAMDFKKTSADAPTSDNLTTEGANSGMYVKLWPACPSGGTYAINAVGTNPTCTIAGHVLP